MAKRLILLTVVVTIVLGGCALFEARRPGAEGYRNIISGYGGVKKIVTYSLRAVYKTTNLNLNKPTRGHAPWDEEVNYNWDLLDLVVGAILKADGTWKDNVVPENAVDFATDNAAGKVNLHDFLKGSPSSSQFPKWDGSDWVPDTPSGTPGGSDTQVQFNDGGAFGGDADFTWDKSGNILDIPKIGHTGNFQMDLKNPSANTVFHLLNSEATYTSGFRVDGYLRSGSDTGSGGSVYLYDTDSSDPEYVQLLPPTGANLTTSYSLRFPITKGNAGELLKSNGDGTTDWLSEIGWTMVSKTGSSLADLETKTHSLLSGLSADDHTIYALLAGRAGGQNFIGGTGSGDDLTLESTSHATKGDVILQPNGGNIGIGTTTLLEKLTVNGGVAIGDPTTILPKLTGDQSSGYTRLFCQPTSGNQQMNFFFLPSGTQDASGIQVSNDSDLSNRGRIVIRVDGKEAQILTSKTGTGTAPETMEIGGGANLNSITLKSGAGGERLVFDGAHHKFGIFDATPDSPVEILSTTNPQVRISHTDTIDDMTLGVDANGDAEIKASGGDISFHDENIATTGRGTFGQLIIPSGTTPAPDVEGALFLDTDAGANGTLVIYSNGAWRTVQAL